MVDIDIDETTSLFWCSRKVPRYGTTSDVTIRSDYKIISHKILPSDTLQGIALKYGTTVMEIKRLNKLWSTDNIYIYESLNIPVESSSNGVVGNGFHADSPEKKRQDESHVSAAELLKRVDSAIKISSKNIQKFEENHSEFAKDAQRSKSVSSVDNPRQKFDQI